MGLYIQMHSMHGLFRGRNIELGRDEDTGGQIVYVKNLAASLGRQKGVDHVDIITRRIIDKEYPGYTAVKEKLSSNVDIVRIECGPKRYIMKVDLWPYLDEFIANCKRYISSFRMPDILHSNYADSGLVCARLSRDLGIAQVHTGHSLGKPKMERLGVNDSNFEGFNSMYHFSERIKAEQDAIDNSSAIVVSTQEERMFQYSMYDIDVESRKFHVVTPGVNLQKFYPISGEDDKTARKRLLSVISKDLGDLKKPMVFTISRLDFKKNLISLVKAFAYDKELQEIANLVIVAGRLGKLGKNEQMLMDEMESVIKKNGISRKVVIIRHIDYQKEGGEIYRIAKDSRGVFVNPALHEPFGITVLEAGATGLPVVATNNGGPVETLGRCTMGYLIDPRKPRQIAAKVKKIIKFRDTWERFSKNGIMNVKKFYSWDAAAQKELGIFRDILKD